MYNSLLELYLPAYTEQDIIFIYVAALNVNSMQETFFFFFVIAETCL